MGAEGVGEGAQGRSRGEGEHWRLLKRGFWQAEKNGICSCFSCGALIPPLRLLCIATSDE